MSFFSELGRRNVFRVGLAYLAAVWLVLQVADVVLPNFGAPAWAIQALVFSSVLGLPLTLVLAWFYEWTPQGIKATADVVAVEDVKFFGRKLDFAIIGLLVVAVGFLLVANNVAESPHSSIAVLPFENESEAEENAEFFAAGIHEAILTQLAKIADIRVISRTSVMEYQDSRKSAREIGEELGVATILEGSVFRAGDAVRINVQLIDAGSDEHLWAELYDRALTAENLFAIQSEMAMAIAGALEATLLPEELARLSEVPTENTRAYDFYLSGNAYFNRPDDRTYKPLAVQQYERAVAEDPGFALAWAAMSRAHVTIYWFMDPSPARLAMAEEAARQASMIDPDAPETHIALGLLYDLGHRDYDRALAEYAVAEQALPDSAYVTELAAYTQRRMGDFRSAAERFERLLERDPRNLDLLEQLANTLTHLREYDEADRYLDRALELAPDFNGVFVLRAWNAWRRDGDVRQLKEIVQDPSVQVGSEADYFLWAAALYERNYDEALASLDRWDVDAFSEQYLYAPKSLFAGVAHQLAGHADLAQAAFRAARDRAEAELESNPGDPRLHIALAQALTGLGELEAGEASARRAMQIMPRSKDDFAGGWFQREAVVGVFAPAGNMEAVVTELDDFLTRASAWSIEGLLPDPRLDAVRDAPAFRALVEKYRNQR